MSDRLFSVTRDQFELQFFRAGGKGGQKQNKTSSACRIIHLASGAVGESRDERQQTQNRKLAFGRLVQSETFQRWLNLETSRAQGRLADIEQDVNKAMAPANVLCECRATGKWARCECPKDDE